MTTTPTLSEQLWDDYISYLQTTLDEEKSYQDYIGGLIDEQLKDIDTW